MENVAFMAQIAIAQLPTLEEFHCTRPLENDAQKYNIILIVSQEFRNYSTLKKLIEIKEFWHLIQ